MTDWNAAAVIAAANEWVWIPDGAPHVRTNDFLLIRYPDWFATPTTARSLGSAREPASLVDEAAAIASAWHRDDLWWVVSDVSESTDLESELLRRGAEVAEPADILALTLDTGLPDLGVPAGIEVIAVTDEETLRDACAVEAEAFGYASPSDEQVADGIAEVYRGAADGSVGRFVAYLDGVPAGVGGWGMAGEVMRLWGAGTTAAARGRGAYRAVLDARLRLGRELGATLGLTHGRVGTSSPILQRIGFSRYGEQRQLRLTLT